MATRETTIARLLSEIAWAEKQGEPGDGISWDDQFGILLSRDQAKIALEALRGAAPEGDAP